MIICLVTKAFSYTPAAGQVTVSTTVREQQGQKWAGIAVSDTGPGITAQDQEHLFTRFYRGQAGRDSGKSGTGLGLAIAHEIVKRHSGMIEVESAGIAGQGTTFSIWLPVLEAD